MKPVNSEEYYVLLVEDDPVASGLFKRSLEGNRLCSYFVDQAYSIDEALQKIQNNAYDLLLAETDIKESTGINLIEKVQRIPHLNLPCVLIGSEYQKQIRSEAIKAGASDFIVKNNNNIQELMARLQKVHKSFWAKHGESPGVERRKDVGNLQAIQMEKEGSKLSNFSVIQDDLTGLYTHSYLHDRLHLEYSLAQSHKAPLSCVVLDIDHFRTINEKYGYKTADALLKQCAKILFESCRLSDVIARHSGESFAVLLPNTTYEGANELAERLKGLFHDYLFEVDGQQIRLTLSFGISAFPDDPIDQATEMIEFATQSLFKSKASGRNRITLYRDVLPSLGEVLPDMLIHENKVLEFQRKMTEISNIARRAYLDASRTLITLLEVKDAHTAGHSANCAKYSMQTAQVMGLNPEEVEMIQHGALLHDIGKICIPDRILLKPGKLTFQEYETVKQHVYFGHKIVKPIQFLQQEALIVLHHHEWWNGEGYPCKLKGNEIPLGARIVGVVDTYDTIRMAGGRYKKTQPVAAAANELIAYSGIQFDPNVVAAFIEVLKMRGDISEADIDREKLDQAIIEAKAPAA